MMKTALLLASLFFALLVLELGCFILAKTNLLRMPMPSYSLGNMRPSPTLKPNQRFWADINPHFGVWHEPYSTLKHKKSCFSVEYRANSHGMRDPERTLESPTQRVAFLGDSVVEGFGVERSDRLTTLLEVSTGVDVLNFGTAGDFGPTQYYLLYKHLANQFSHDVVLIGMLPGNDFRDDDIVFGRRIYHDRYRPYWVGTSPDYELVYHRAELDSSAAAPPPADAHAVSGSNLKLLLKNFSYAYNAVSYTKHVVTRNEPAVGSGFYDFTEEQLAKAEHSFGLIAEEAGDRPVVLILLPLENDLVRHNGAGESPLSAELHKFAAEKGILLLDLLPLMSAHNERWSEYFLECDGHWNAYGHQTAASFVRDFLVERNLLSPDPG